MTVRETTTHEMGVSSSPAISVPAEEVAGAVPSMAPLPSLFGADSSESAPSIHGDTRVRAAADDLGGEGSVSHHSGASAHGCWRPWFDSTALAYG